MRFPNGYGTVYNLSGKRRRPFVAAVPVGFKPNGKVIQQVLDYYRTRQEGLAALADYNEKKKGISASADFKEFKKYKLPAITLLHRFMICGLLSATLIKATKYQAVTAPHTPGAKSFTVCRLLMYGKCTCKKP